MSIRDDLTIDWTASPRIIEVADPSTALTVQDLYDTLRSKAAASEAMDDAEIIEASGKEDLGGTPPVLVGLTVKLLNAKVKFEAKASPTVCNVSGGNLVAVDANEDAMYPIAFSTNVTVMLAQSTSPSLIEGADPDAIADAVWDELLLEHAILGSLAEAIKDARDNAELAFVTN
jgi:hypothetical protein